MPLAELALLPNTAAVTQAVITDVREFPRTWEESGFLLGDGKARTGWVGDLAGVAELLAREDRSGASAGAAATG